MLVFDETYLIQLFPIISVNISFVEYILCAGLCVIFIIFDILLYDRIELFFIF